VGQEDAAGRLAGEQCKGSCDEVGEKSGKHNNHGSTEGGFSGKSKCSSKHASCCDGWREKILFKDQVLTDQEN